MAIPFRALIFLFAIISGVITSFTVFAEEPFDRLDGSGQSKNKVDVIEWDGNLEVHSYPKGSLKGLGAKLDDRTEGKKVMVIGYHFANTPTPFVRRAILGIPMTKNFKAFIDPTAKGYDKLALSTENLSKPFIPYKLEAAPKQWYPDGDPRNEEEIQEKNILTGIQGAPNTPAKTGAKGRTPASVETPHETSNENDGAIQNFSW